MYGIDTQRADVRWFLCALLLICGMAQAEQFFTQVIAVIDGDTVLIRRSNGLLKVRLADIDAPEVGQPFGAESQRALSEMVNGRQVKFVSQAMDKYGRMVAHLSVNGRDVNAEQIREGMAWEYSHYHGNRALIALQTEAQQGQRGLWATGDATPPWEWRKNHAHVFIQNHAASPYSAKFNDSSCVPKKRCAQMANCAEARHYFLDCGEKYLDGNHDGVPCEKLCAPHDKKHAGQP